MDGKDVQDGAVSEGAVSSDGASTPVAPQTLTREDIAEMLRANNEDMSRRLKQSFDDKLKAQRMAPDMPALPSDTDSEVKAKVYEDYFNRQRVTQAQAAHAEQQRVAAEQFATDWQDSNTEFLVDLGIAPGDKRLDWGEGKDYLTRQKRLHASASKIIKERLDGSAKEAKKQADEQVAKAAVEAGLESNPTGVAPAGGGLKKYTRQQIAGMSYAEYKANEKDIDAATREGRIT